MQIRSGVKCAMTAAVAALLVLVTSAARANGRFPRGEHLIEYPSDPNRLLLAATYGLVATDDGKSWYYICESAFSLYPAPSMSDPGYTGDPLLQLTADESILAGVDKRITKSTDRGCGWAKVFEDASKAIDDIAVAASSRNTAVALVRTVSSGMTQVYETTDGGITWNPIGTPLSMIVLGHTIDVDPKDPTHLMVTGVTSFDESVASGVFLNSTNHGMTWVMTSIPKTNVASPAYIAAVHPTDGKKVFVRTDEWVDDGGGATNAQDALLYTKDGGQTWTELLRPKGVDGGGAKLYAFALSPDGSTALAGFGDPVEGGGRIVDRDVMGVYKSTGADYSFGATPKAVFVESATCLTWTNKGIYVCGSPDGMTSYISFASDVNNVTSTGLKKIMQVDQLKGEPLCCAGRAVTSCDWPTDCDRFKACVDGGSEPDAGVCTMPEAGRGDSGTDASSDRTTGGSGGTATGGAGGSGTAGSAGSGTGGAGTGGAVDAGKSGAAGAGTGGASGSSTGGTGGAGTGGSGTGGSGEGDSSCSCRTAATPSGRSAPAWGLLLGLVGASGWRRSRRRQKAA